MGADGWTERGIFSFFCGLLVVSEIACPCAKLDRSEPGFMYFLADDRLDTPSMIEVMWHVMAAKVIYG